MHHDTDLINIVAVGLGLAFIFGALANKLRLSPLVGYLVAGICVGPFTPGFVADQALANQLAELGVMLLMFGVGLHFSLKDLMAVKAIAIPGAIGQILVATLLGWGLAALMGWPVIHGIVFGFALATASTVVLLRAMEERRLLETQRGKIAVGWLIVEDLAMVLALVLFRLGWRLYAGAPKPVPGVPSWQERIASATHVLLYVLMFAIPLSGWLYDSASGLRPFRWFGLVDVPKLSGPDPQVVAVSHAIHEYGFWLLIAVVLAHAGAAFYHHLFQRDATLSRMLPRGWLASPQKD